MVDPYPTIIQEALRDFTIANGTGFNVVKDFGADNTGIKSSVSAILSACQAALIPDAYGKPNRGVYVPPGRYLLDRSLDFSTLNYTGLTGNRPALTGVGSINGFSFICDPAAVFVVATGVTNTSIVNVAPATNTQQFINCVFQFGSLVDPTNQTGNNGIQLQSIQDSKITVGYVGNFSGSGVLANPRVDVGIFNNYIDIREIVDCNNGVATLGNTLPNLYGFQGNEVHLGQVTNCVTGLNIDANGINKSTQWNTFHCSAVETCTNAVVDASGENTYIFASSTGNTTSAFTLLTGANFSPVIIGNISDPIILNGGKAIILNGQEAIDDGQKFATTADTTITATTATAITGLSKVISSPGTHGRWMVNVTLDLKSDVANGSTTFIGEITVDGTVQTPALNVNMPTAGLRQPVTQTLYLTGLTKGNHTIAVQGRNTGAGASYTASFANSSITNVRIR